MEYIEDHTTCHTVREIRQRKEKVLAEIRKDSNSINLLWKDLFRDNTQKKKGLTISSVMSTGAGILDGFLFFWKLYRKFKR